MVAALPDARRGFFEVAAGHDGVVEDFRPLTRTQAYDFLKTHATHLLEKILRTVSGRIAIKPSRRTIIAAVEVLDGFLLQAALTRLLLKFDSGLSRKCSSGSVAQRCNFLIQALDEDHGQHVEDGQLLADALVEAAVGEIVADRKRPQWGDRYELPTVAAFEHALDRDGFVLEADALRRTLPAMMRLPKVDDQVVRLLDKHAFEFQKAICSKLSPITRTATGPPRIRRSDHLWKGSSSRRDGSEDRPRPRPAPRRDKVEGRKSLRAVC